MTKPALSLLILLLLVTPSVTADDNVCPCIPISYVWVVTSCDTWDCALSQMVLGAGDPYVMTLPTPSKQYKWVVMRRVVAGTATVSPDEPFIVDSFNTVADASTRFAGMDPDTLPMIVSAYDGRTLLVRLRAPQRRRPAAGH